MFPVHWNELVRQIDRSLPGRGLWMHCAPVFDDDRPTEEGVGLALQRESGPETRRYVVVFFSVIPDPGAVAPGGRFAPGRGEEVSDWRVEVGYQGEFDALKDAVEEAKELASGLPKSGLYPGPERIAAFLDRVTDPDDLDEIA